MKVKCIKNSISLFEKDLVKKGNIYTVKDVIVSNVRYDGSHNVWFLLEEIEVLIHHASLFEIIEIHDNKFVETLLKNLNKRGKLIQFLNTLIK